MTDGAPLIVGADNETINVTSLLKNRNFLEALFIENSAGVALNCVGGQGKDGSGNPIPGEAISAFSLIGPGVNGESDASIGVQGFSRHGAGVVGKSDTASGVSGISDQTIGVSGHSEGAQNAGVGVQGSCDAGFGVFGASVRGWAGVFLGRILILGDMQVTGVKSAVVEHPDGSRRRLYCMESPEGWFEDFGTTNLVDGSARIELDDDFAALTDTSNYFVFVMPEGDCRGLYVSAKNPAWFEVRESAGGASNIPFSYRIVARRRDISGARLEVITLPEVNVQSAPTPAPSRRANPRANHAVPEE